MPPDQPRHSFRPPSRQVNDHGRVSGTHRLHRQRPRSGRSRRGGVTGNWRRAERSACPPAMEVDCETISFPSSVPSNQRDRPDHPGRRLADPRRAGGPGRGDSARCRPGRSVASDPRRWPARRAEFDREPQRRGRRPAGRQRFTPVGQLFRRCDHRREVSDHGGGHRCPRIRGHPRLGDDARASCAGEAVGGDPAAARAQAHRCDSRLQDVDGAQG